jgi:hypothetical protein
MHVLGLVLIIAGFWGAPALVLLNVTQNLPFTLAVHIAGALILIWLCSWKCGSFQAWVTYTKTGALYKGHPAGIVLIGLLFLMAGSYLILKAEPSGRPNTMSSQEIDYFGSIFLLIGAGVAAAAVRKLLRPGER